jgi:hypothetical protein
MDGKMNFVTTSFLTFAHKQGHNFPPPPLAYPTPQVFYSASFAPGTFFTTTRSNSHLSKESDGNPYRRFLRQAPNENAKPL